MTQLTSVLTVLVAAAAAAAAAAHARPAYDLIIDVDASAFVRSGLDVHDDLALIWAFANKSATAAVDTHVIGITTTFGNVPTHQATLDVRLVLAVLGRAADVPVFSGAAYSSRLSDAPSNATRFILDSIRGRAALRAQGQDVRPLVLVMLGAKTNLAAALYHARAEVEAPGALAAVVLMGGDTASRNPFDVELSFAVDRESVRTVLGSRLRKIVVPVQTSIQVVLTKRWLGALYRQCCLDRPVGSKAAICGARDGIMQYATLMPFVLNWMYRSYVEASTDLMFGTVPFDEVALGALMLPRLYSHWTRAHITMPDWSSHVFFQTDPAPVEAVGDIGELFFSDSASEENLVWIPRKVDAKAFLDELAEGLCNTPMRAPYVEHVKHIPGYATEASAVAAALLSVLAAVLYGCFCMPRPSDT